jgi:hypothetical protein
MKPLQKTLAASGIAAASIGLSGPANALIEASPGEALLVPFVLFSSAQDGAGPTQDPPFGATPVIPEINTLIQVTVPAQVGFDTIPRFFTAPNTTPTQGFPLEGDNPALGATGAFEAGIHVFFFDDKSVKQADFSVPTSPDDLITINWGDYVRNNQARLDGTKGYIVITNEKADPDYYPFGWNSAAAFPMMGDAYMVWNPLRGVGLIDTKIPVLPMSDGDDFADDEPSIRDNVIFNGNRSIKTVSPLASGMRTNLSDDDLSDYTLFDLTMSNRFAPTLHVIWVDQNVGLPANNVSQLVFDDDEQNCSDDIPIAKELQVYWTSPPLLQPNFGPDGNPRIGPTFGNAPGGSLLNNIWLKWVDAAVDLCYPDRGQLVFNPESLGDLFDVLESNILYPGFVRFRLNEYVDTGIGEPESAAVAFSIQLQLDVLDEEGDLLRQVQFLPVETALGHERGQFGDRVRPQP